MLQTHPYAQRLAPPVRPSQSLEGLERVIPPTSPKSPFTPTRSELFLNKPLPAKPLPEAPTEEYSAMWSDTSDSESQTTVDSVDSVNSPSEPRISTESYPIFVSSGSDDFSDLVDHPSTTADHDSDRHRLSLGRVRSSPQLVSNDSRTDSGLSDPGTESSSVFGRSIPISLSETQYGRAAAQWPQNRTGTNHYFREKKWDFFPELATPSALQACGRVSPGIRAGKTRKKESRLGLVTKRHRWHSLDRAGLGLAHGLRDSIRTYVHRTLSKESPEKTNELMRPVTAPVQPPYDRRSFQRRNSTTGRHSSANLDTQLRVMSLSTVSVGDMPESPRSIRTQRSAPAPRQKQLAVPMSEYQKYGSSIWDSPKKSKRSLRLPKSSKQPADLDTDTSSSTFTYANPTPPLSPPLKLQLQQNTQSAVRVLQGGTSHVLVALDGAKRKMIESRDERRREALKSQIRLVGPIDPHDCL